MRRARRGEQRVALDGRSAVEFDYKGLDGKLRRTRLVFDPPPTMLANNVASYTVRLKPDEPALPELTLASSRLRS